MAGMENDCVVLDRVNVSNEGVSFVLNGPVVDVSLPSGTTKKFGEEKKEEVAFVLPKEWSGLDSISLDLYVAEWCKLGAKVGRVVNGCVKWE